MWLTPAALQTCCYHASHMWLTFRIVLASFATNDMSRVGSEKSHEIIIFIIYND